MDSCIIFGAAGLARLVAPIETGDLLIAADGGLRHFDALGRKPDVIIGDFDSLGFVPQDAVVFPVEKDDTDLMLAVRHALSKGFRKFFLYGAFDGSRLDHTIANFQTLAFLQTQGAHGWLVGKQYIATVIQKETLQFPASFDGILSVFCMGSDASGVTIRGLKYNLEDAALSSAYPLGVSNHFVGTQAEISVKNGMLLLLWDAANGLPVVL